MKLEINDQIASELVGLIKEMIDAHKMCQQLMADGKQQSAFDVNMKSIEAGMAIAEAIANCFIEQAKREATP